MGRKGKFSFLFIVHEFFSKHGEQRNNYSRLRFPWVVFMLTIILFVQCQLFFKFRSE
jgi:hypothetical protein